jgi:prepilin-type N-terminal cleavage/methylation domain-containing protein
MKRRKKRLSGLGMESKGFSLVEVVIAIAIVAFTFITLIGLLGGGVASDQKSSQQTVASGILASIVADLRSTPDVCYETAYSNNTAAGTITQKTTRYQITLPKPTTSETSIMLPQTSTPPPPLKGVLPIYLYFDNDQNELPLGNPNLYTTLTSTPPTGSVYVAAVYLPSAPIIAVGPDANSSTQLQYQLMQTTHMARVVVSWPAQTQGIPVGSVEAVTEFRLH